MRPASARACSAAITSSPASSGTVAVRGQSRYAAIAAIRSSGTSSSAHAGIHGFCVRNAAFGSAPVSEPITVEVISKRRWTGRPIQAGFGGKTMIAEPLRRPGATVKRGFWNEKRIALSGSIPPSSRRPVRSRGCGRRSRTAARRRALVRSGRISASSSW